MKKETIQTIAAVAGMISLALALFFLGWAIKLFFFSS